MLAHLTEPVLKDTAGTPISPCVFSRHLGLSNKIGLAEKVLLLSVTVKS